MSTDLIFSPTDFIAVFNQTLEQVYPRVIIEGELASFKVSKKRWVHFELKDDVASVRFFGTIYQLPGPLQDGLMIRAVGAPRLHPRFGFSINLQSLQPVGEGSIKKTADLLHAKLEREGLFAPERKRTLPLAPRTIGLITASDSAACADFIKILNGRWGGVEVLLADTLVQGDQAPLQLMAAIEHLNQLPAIPDLLVITRGGGSADDLAAFSDERVVRAVAASRVPTLVAIGHEVDISLAELAADVRASTPTNAAQIAVPDKSHIISQLGTVGARLQKFMLDDLRLKTNEAKSLQKYLTNQVNSVLAENKNAFVATRKLVGVFDPHAALKRGYAIVAKGRDYIRSIQQVSKGDSLNIELSDGKINATAE